jgi:hypothetical protein
LEDKNSRLRKGVMQAPNPDAQRKVYDFVQQEKLEALEKIVNSVQPEKSGPSNVSLDQVLGD